MAKKNIHSERYVFLIYILVVFSYVVAGSFSPFPGTWGDAAVYLGLPINLVYHGAFAFGNYPGTAVPPPFYPLYLVPAVWVAWDHVSLQIFTTVLNSIALGTLILLSVAFGKMLRISLLSSIFCGLLIVLTPGAFQYTQDVMTESVYIPFLVAAILLCCLKRSPSTLFGLTLVSTLSVMTKPLGLVPVIVYTIFVSMDMWKKQELKSFWMPLLCAWVVPLMSLAVWFEFAPSLCDFATQGYPKGFIAVVLKTLSDPSAFVLFLHRMANLLGYTLISSYFLPLVFLIPDSSKTTLKHKNVYMLLLIASVWLGMASLCCIAQGVFFRKMDGHYFLYGRYIEGIIPVITIVSFVQFIKLHAIASSIPRNLSFVAIRICLAAIALGVYAFFPLHHWMGLNSVALSTLSYAKSYVGNRYLIALLFSGLFFTTLLIREWKSFLGVFLYCSVIAISLFGSIQEMKRVNFHKEKWLSTVTNSKAYTMSPPDQTTYLVMDANMTASKKAWCKEAWYLRYVYFKSRYCSSDQFSDKLPEKIMYFSDKTIEIEGLENCGTMGSMKVYCKPN